MTNTNFKNSLKLSNYILLFSLILIGVICSFEFNGLHPVLQTYATNTPDSRVLNQHSNEPVAFQVQTSTTTAPLNQSFAASNKTLIISPQGLSTNPCIGGLPCGTWEIHSKALTGLLFIRSVDNQGNINGSLFGYNISGSWDQIMNKITFTQTIMSGSNQSISYEYSGFYHNICGRSEQPGCAIISGSAIPKTLPPEHAAKQEFGWIAFFRFFT